MWGSHDKPRGTTETPTSAHLTELAQARAALAESEARSEERRLALESHIQDIGFMRIQLRVRNARITALEKEVGALGDALAHRKEHSGAGKSDAASLNDTIAALTATVAERDANIAALKAMQLAEGETVAARQGDFARAIAESDVQRKKLGTLEAALAAANARLAEQEATALAALEQRKSVEAAIGEHRQQIARLEATVAERDSNIAALKAMQLAEGETLAARQGDFAPTNVESEAQRKKLGRLEAALAAANTRLAEKKAAAHAALEQRKSMEAAIAEQRQQIARLEATVAERDANIKGLNATQLAEGKSVAARRSDFARVMAETEIQRKNLAKLEGALAAANARLAEKEASALAALELRNSTEAAIEEQRQQIARLEVELAGAVRDRDESVELAAAVHAELLEQSARLASASARVLELEAQALDPEHASSALEEEPRKSRARDLEADLHTAEDATHRLEAGRRKKRARLDELAKTHDDAPDASAAHEVAPEDATPVFIRTGESEVVHVLGRKTTIGRTPENDVQINAQYISRHHAVILAERTHTIIEDLNSTNGVIVNGRRVMRQALKDGDIVLIGKAPFRFAMLPAAERR